MQARDSTLVLWYVMDLSDDYCEFLLFYSCPAARADEDEVDAWWESIRKGTKHSVPCASQL